MILSKCCGWESDPDSDAFKDDETNEEVEISLENPADARSLTLEVWPG